MRAPTGVAIVAVVLCGLSLAPGAEVRRELRIFDLRVVAGGGQPGDMMLLTPTLRGPLVGMEEAAVSFGDPASVLEPDDVVAVIQDYIEPDSWSNRRNRMETDGDRLRVVQTPDVLDRIGRFIQGLEAVAGRLVSLDVALVPPAALERAAHGATAPGAEPWLEATAFDEAVREAAGDARVFSTLARAGVEAQLYPSTTARHLIDHDVNCTGVMPVVNPVAASLLEGAYGRAVVLPGPRGRWLRVDVAVGRVETTGKPGKVRLSRGEVELVRREHQEVRTSVLVPPDKAMLVGCYAPALERGEDPGEPAARPFAALLRVRCVAVPGAVELPDDSEIHLLPIGALLEPIPEAVGFRLGGGGEENAPTISFTEEDEHDEEAERKREILIQALGSLFPKDAEPEERFRILGRLLVVRSTAEDARRVAATLERIARDRMRVVGVDVVQGALTPEGARAMRGVLEEDALERLWGRAGVRARFVGVEGAVPFLASVAGRSYVSEVEMLSGGTGFRVGIVGDPVVSFLGGGLVVELDTDLVPDTGWAELHVRGEVARPPRFERKGRVREQQVVDVVEGEGPRDKPGARAAGDWLALDLPDEDSEVWEHLVTAPRGRPVLLNVLPDRSRAGTSRALVAVVRELELPLEEGGEGE